MVIGIIIAVILFGTLFYFQNKSKKKASESTLVVNKDYVSVASKLTQFEAELLKLTNEHRVSIGLTTIDYTDEAARQECQGHCKFMKETGVTGHQNFPDRVKKMRENGAKHVSEVVSYGYGTAKGVIHGFLNSPKHKAALEGEKATHIGIRMMKNKENRNLVTMILIYF